MIPKKIHYCWFGRGKKPEMAEKCIASWKKYCKDYEIIEWNEDNFDINSNQYVREAYENRKFAFVTDYVRLYVLYNEGGIYMDTDVEVIKSLDRFLTHPAFSSFENNNKIPTGIMASEKKNKWVKYMLSYYKNAHFVKEDGTLDLTTNVETITRMTMEKYNLVPNDTYQDLGDVVFYSHDWFCPKDWHSGKIFLTKNSHTIHHFNGSWLTDEEKRLKIKLENYIEKFGRTKGLSKYENYKKRYYFKLKVLKVLKNPFIVFRKLKKR